MAAIPKTMTAATYLDTTDLAQQLATIATRGAWYVPAHIIDDVCRRAAHALAAKEQ